MQKNKQPQSTAARVWLCILGAVLALAGLFFLVGGGKLITLGGSWYFALAGAALLASGVQFVRQRPAGAGL